MRGEYHALGVDFDRRNALFDEAIEVILGVWTQDDFAHQGMTFTAKGQTANPKPDPLPGPNSAAAANFGTVMGDGGYWVGIPFDDNAHSPAFMRVSTTCG